MSKQCVVRVDDDLWEWLQADAVDNGRTVSQSIRHYLRMIRDADDAAETVAAPAPYPAPVWGPTGPAPIWTTPLPGGSWTISSSMGSSSTGIAADDDLLALAADLRNRAKAGLAAADADAVNPADICPHGVDRRRYGCADC